MKINILKLILVEGNHDASFIARIMLSCGYVKSKSKLKEFPQFLSSFIHTLLSDSDEDRTYENNKYRLLPAYVLKTTGESKEVALVFATNGMRNKPNYSRIVSPFIAQINDPFGRKQLSYIGEIKVIINLDADKEGVDNRMNEINEIIRELTDDGFTPLSNFQWAKYKDITWGGFVSSAEDGFGSLEDFVLPLIEEDRDELVAQVKALLDNPEQHIGVAPSKQDAKKSEIGIIGQLDMPGVSNTVIIERSQLIDNEALNKGVYKKIMDFITM